MAWTTERQICASAHMPRIATTAGAAGEAAQNTRAFRGARKRSCFWPASDAMGNTTTSADLNQKSRLRRCTIKKQKNCLESSPISIFSGYFARLLRYLPAGQSSMCNSTTPVDRRKRRTYAKFRAKRRLTK